MSRSIIIHHTIARKQGDLNHDHQNKIRQLERTNTSNEKARSKKENTKKSFPEKKQDRTNAFPHRPIRIFHFNWLGLSVVMTVVVVVVELRVESCERKNLAGIPPQKWHTRPPCEEEMDTRGRTPGAFLPSIHLSIHAAMREEISHAVEDSSKHAREKNKNSKIRLVPAPPVPTHVCVCPPGRPQDRIKKRCFSLVMTTSSKKKQNSKASKQASKHAFLFPPRPCRLKSSTK